MSKGKIGKGTLAAAGRLGLKELRNAFNPSRESVADTEIGMYGTATQGEIAEARGGAGQGLEQESKTVSLDDLRQDAAKRSRDNDNDRGQERGGMDM